MIKYSTKVGEQKKNKLRERRDDGEEGGMAEMTVPDMRKQKHERKKARDERPGEQIQESNREHTHS